MGQGRSENQLVIATGLIRGRPTGVHQNGAASKPAGDGNTPAQKLASGNKMILLVDLWHKGR
jgi:hypothetical protein